MLGLGVDQGRGLALSRGLMERMAGYCLKKVSRALTFAAPSGLPLVQHTLNVMLSFYFDGKMSLEKIVEKMCHAPADCFNVEKRGYLDEGNWADVVVVDLNKTTSVSKENILYKCAWSPLEGQILRGSIEATIVSGHLAYENGQFFDDKMGERLLFNEG